MKRIKSFICLMLFAFLLSTPVLAKEQTVNIDFFEDKENSIKISLPSDYLYFTDDDVDKSADYFKKMPIDKNEAIEQIREGTYLNAFSESKGSQIVLKITSDNFSEKIGNFSPMDDNDKASVIKNFKSIYEQSGHSFLMEPDIIDVDGYDFIRFNCRYGNGDKGFSYKSILTIICGNCYELVSYNKMSVPDDTVSEEFDNMVSSIRISIKGEQGQITKSYFMSVFAVIVIIIAVIIIISMIYSLIREYIVRKNHNEKVKLKKRWNLLKKY